MNYLGGGKHKLQNNRGDSLNFFEDITQVIDGSKLIYKFYTAFKF